ncbi:unnamed protein product [Tuber melanosporum]|uniref:(Perigord truffle) hypothetical protein n=1 Tax=Tuber melanosporum (strain Mel28) TaxID=656061 RepID=D5GEW0_TUBMM|nr:uncharacterized protein GSTUM_00001414001 [Tuber melanosporum]CAZ83053.1 unnamed protein product [Tuber melanosporum]
MSPPNLDPLEILGILQTWAVRSFVFLGILTMTPAILILLYDATLYVWRYLILAPLTGTPFPEQAAETARREEVEITTTTATTTRSTLTTVTAQRRRALSGSAERPLVTSVERLVEPIQGLKGVGL